MGPAPTAAVRTRGSLQTNQLAGAQARRRLIVFAGEDRRIGDEVHRDRDGVVDDAGRRELVVKADGHDIGPLHAGTDARRSIGAGKRGNDVGADGGIVGNDRANDEHDVRFRMTAPQVRRARVIAVGRNAAWVVPEGDSAPLLAALRKTQARAHPVPGDLARIRALDEGRVVIDGLEPRSFALVRRTPGGRTKTMAANVDTLAIVAALAQPPPSLTLVDRLIAFAVQHGVAAALILTKPDLAPAQAAAGLGAVYEPLDVPVLVVQPKSGSGIEELRSFLAGRHALLVGNSGVGKSSIFAALGGIAAVGEVSRFGRGRQTTSSARLFASGEGFLIDSPGIGEFTLDPLSPVELADLFVELREPARACRFFDCRHLSEPDCAVRAAVEAGGIALSRYASYRALVEAGDYILDKLR